MFGFIGKFKNEVVAGFDAIHQRLVTLEAKVEALFEHTKQTTVDNVKADAAAVEATATKAETVAADAVKTVEDAKG